MPGSKQTSFLLTVADVPACFPLIEITAYCCGGSEVHIVCAGEGKAVWGSEGVQALGLAGGAATDGGGREAAILRAGGSARGVPAVPGVQRGERGVTLRGVRRQLSGKVTAV